MYQRLDGVLQQDVVARLDRALEVRVDVDLTGRSRWHSI